MKSKPFVILDRDGTIIRECEYLTDPAGVELLPNAAPGLRRLRESGCGLVVITNQSGIGRGFLTHDRLAEIHTAMTRLLARESVSLDGIYYCPHRPEEQCRCRKPLPGLLEQAGRELGFSPQDCFVIGDKACDIDLGKAVGAATFLVRTGYGAAIAADPDRLAPIAPDYIADDLLDAARQIDVLRRRA